ncbi:Cystatin-11 [Camelus dromedarius]|uniref:Cystatin-11 n=2 Tax=Camelus TaxID=9836 RepID=A0A5N4CUH6_CAMDR|nr:cystatin-11 [Camelus dromedarius]KAB1262509.1 Cystatin-11 [Camelus dromedarius]
MQIWTGEGSVGVPPPRAGLNPAEQSGQHTDQLWQPKEEAPRPATMARAPQGPRLLLAIVGALVALTYQTRRKTFISVREVPASASVVVTTLDYVTKEFNKKSEDKYNFRVVRVPKVVQKLTDHMEYHIDVEMRRTVCFKSEANNCSFQDGELYKKIDCFFSVSVLPWFEKYKLLTKNCTDG